MDSHVLQTPSSHNADNNVTRKYAVADGATPSLQEYLDKYQNFREPAVLLSCGRSFERLRTINDFTMAQAFSSAWTCQPLEQPNIPRIAICHIDGIIKKVYKDLNWFPADTPNPSGLTGYVQLFKTNPAKLWAFSANEAPFYSWLVGLDLRPHLTQRGMANPVRYVNCR